jgi:hypothetical protein
VGVRHRQATHTSRSVLRPRRHRLSGRRRCTIDAPRSNIVRQFSRLGPLGRGRLVDIAQPALDPSTDPDPFAAGTRQQITLVTGGIFPRGEQLGEVGWRERARRPFRDRCLDDACDDGDVGRAERGGSVPPPMPTGSHYAPAMCDRYTLSRPNLHQVVKELHAELDPAADQLGLPQSNVGSWQR